MNKKLIAILASSFILFSCSNSEPTKNNDETATASITETPSSSTNTKSDSAVIEEYLVTTDSGYPPFDFLDENGRVQGFDVDVLTAIGKDQNFKVTFISQPRKQLFESLQKGTHQIAAACLGINPERLKISEMSNPYVSAPNIIMTRPDIHANVLADLNGLNVATQKGSYSATSLSDIPVKSLQETDTLFSAFQAFTQGKVDAVVGDAGSLTYWASQHPDLKFRTSIYDTTEDVRVGFAVQKGNIELIEKINKGLENIRNNGSYDEIYDKWFGDDKSMKL